LIEFATLRHRRILQLVSCIDTVVCVARGPEVLPASKGGEDKEIQAPNKHEASKPFVSVAERFPDLIAQAVDWNPYEVPYGSGKLRTWNCGNPRHPNYEQSPNKRSRGDGCPTCSGKRAERGVNTLSATNPELIGLADGWDLDDFTKGSSEMKRWLCVSPGDLAPHSYSMVIYAKVGGRGCAVCSGKQVSPGINDLATTHPEIAKEADGWDCATVTAGSNKVLNWKCRQGHRTTKSVAQRVAAQASGCVFCANLKAWPGDNDVATRFPDIAREAHGWEPTLVVFASEKKMNWCCLTCGEVWAASVRSRTMLRSGCPHCAGNVLTVGINDLAFRRPDLAAEWHPTRNGDLSPDQVAFGTRTKVWWVCPEGHDYRMSVGSRSGSQASGCSQCATSGFNDSKPGWVYLLRHEAWGLLKIGITNEPKVRLYTHGLLGFELLDISEPMRGGDARSLESSIKTSLHIAGVELGPSPIRRQFNGYTECWFETTYSVKSLSDLTTRLSGW